MFFGVKDVCRRQLLDLGLGKAPATALAVSLANLPYWLVRCPAELLKTRQQASLSSFAELKAYVSKEGLSGVYASYPSNLLYALPADLLKFLACEARLPALASPLISPQMTSSPAHSTTLSREARSRVWTRPSRELWPDSLRRRPPPR